MRLQPIVYTTDVARAVEWYAAVLGAEPAYSSDSWTSFDLGGATLGIHHVDGLPVRGRVELSLVADSLENVLERLNGHGIGAAGPIEGQPFGRSVVLHDPDGTPVQVNEHH
ncbi:MAG: VOC family protein [Acidimicrobiia bacterium]|nr:VOC family protein [Acidimicrobiia bacterium]